MSKLRKVRWNSKVTDLLHGNTEPFWAGYMQCRRDSNMDMARRFQKDGARDLTRLFVDFARDDHRRYIEHLKRIRAASLVQDRMAAYREMVLAKMLGAMQ